MISVKTLAIKKDSTLPVVYFMILTAAATIAPLLGHNQALTGPIVNAALFMAVIFLGPQSAILAGLIPSVVALSVGLLPAILAPMIPFIMISNAILISTFALFYRRNFWLGIVTASFLKFVFLIATSNLAASLIMKQEIAQKVLAMMSWPQLLTALAGGLLAYIILKGLKRA